MLDRRLFLQALGAAGAAAAVAGAPPAVAAPTITGPNREALKALLDADPVLTGVTPLGDFDPDISEGVFTHAGPPVDYAHMSGAQRGALWAAILFEGLASDLDGAKRLAPHVHLTPNHHHRGVGGMAGVLSRSMLVYVTEDRGKRAYSVHEYESLFGLFDGPTIDQIRFWNTVVMPTIGRALQALGGVHMNPIMADALKGGDDLHCLVRATTDALIGVLAPKIIETSNDADGAATVKELAAFPHLAGLGIAMGSSKAATLHAKNIAGSSMVVTMARNGTEEGVQLAGTGDEWFVVPAAEIALVPFPGNEGIKAGRDLGDSAVEEVMGRGAGCAAAAAYSGLAAEVGLTPAGMIRLSRRQAKISLGTADAFPILQLGHGPGIGLDARLVVAKNIAPSILTAAAAAEPGHAILGLGVSEMPVACLRKALAAV